ncbi:hypothetical protein H4R18_000936 [Coemansia javaensis]|uniref:Major facilitator superfamily (MFS) profile domain-containing protein n=1 Tax=Coemansia javaensis TaxID=2761396 RepID=A0A9W8HJL9_9FUNG|nr:hypothetical protein H4R18_000936 [Coemansia javaensis]
MPARSQPHSDDTLDHRPLPPPQPADPGPDDAATHCSSAESLMAESLMAEGAEPRVAKPHLYATSEPPSSPARSSSSSSAGPGPGPAGSPRQLAAFFGLFFTIFLSGLDQTVASTILARIADDFRALDRVEWVPTIFMLCSTAVSIVSGRVSDIFGRFPVLIFSLAAFVAGAAASAAAPSMVVFIAARGFSGIACGIMLNLSIIIISDLVPIERRGRYLGILQVCFGVSNAAGPLLGGLFADRISWRAAFVADLGMGVATAVYLSLTLRLLRPPAAKTWRDGLRRLDYVGIAVVVASIALLIVGLNVGGTILPWSSPVTVSCLAVGVALLGVFVAVELRPAAVPLVPMWLFTVRNLVIAFLVTFFCGMAMFSVIFYMPVYFTAVFGATATQAGMLVLPFGLALSLSSVASGHLMSAPGMYRTLLRAGPAVMCAGILLLAVFGARASQPVFSALLLVPGIGMGNVIVSNVIAAQATTDPRFIATVTPICECFLSIGGVIGVAVFGAVHRNKLSQILAAAAAGESPAARAIIDEARRDVSVAYSSTVSPQLRSIITAAYTASIRQALWVLLPFLALALLLSLALERAPVPAKPDEIPLEQIDSP